MVNILVYFKYVWIICKTLKLSFILSWRIPNNTIFTDGWITMGNWDNDIYNFVLCCVYNLQLTKKLCNVSFDCLQAHNAESTHNFLYKCKFKLLNSNLMCNIIICIFLSLKRNKERLSLSNGWIPNMFCEVCLHVVLFDIRHVVSLFQRSIVDGRNYLMRIWATTELLNFRPPHIQQVFRECQILQSPRHYVYK